MMQCINVKLKLKFAIELQAVYLRGTTYLRTPLFGMIPVVTLFVKGAGAVVHFNPMSRMHRRHTQTELR